MLQTSPILRTSPVFLLFLSPDASAPPTDILLEHIDCHPHSHGGTRCACCRGLPHPWMLAPPASKLSKSTTPSRTANPQSTPWEHGPTTADRPQSRCTPSSDPPQTTRTPSRINRMPRCTQPGTCARASGAVRPERRLSAAPSAANCSGARRSSWMSAASPRHVEPRQPVVQALTLG